MGQGVRRHSPSSISTVVFSSLRSSDALRDITALSFPRGWHEADRADRAQLGTCGNVACAHLPNDHETCMNGQKLIHIRGDPAVAAVFAHQWHLSGAGGAAIASGARARYAQAYPVRDRSLMRVAV